MVDVGVHAPSCITWQCSNDPTKATAKITPYLANLIQIRYKARVTFSIVIQVLTNLSSSTKTTTTYQRPVLSLI